MRFTLLAALLVAPLASAVPLELSHQGRLFDSTGAPLATTEQVTIKLYDAPSSGDVLHEETQSITFESGYFSLTIGADSSSPLTLDTFAGDDLYVGLEIGGTPAGDRLKVSSVPFAVRAEQAATADIATSLTGGVVDASEIRVDGNTVITADGLSWDSVIGAPAGLDDGDDDALTALSCSTEGHAAVWDGSAWTCGPLSADIITSGQLSLDRVSVGTTSDTLAAGDHSHTITAADIGAIAAVGDATLDGSLAVTGSVGVGTTSVSCDSSAAGQFRWDGELLEFCNGHAWTYITGANTGAGDKKENAAESCKTILADGHSTGSGTYWLDPTGGNTSDAVQAECDMTTDGGGWTQIFANTFKANHDGLDFTVDCDCSNAQFDHSSTGWLLGISGCAGTNSLTHPGLGQHSWRMEFEPLDIGPASEIRHTGSLQPNRGYDYSWCADLITSTPFANNGEFASMTYDGSSWSWLARYGTSCSTFEVQKSTTLDYPYMIFGYDGGGPGSCDTSNADGGYANNWAIWVR